MNIPHSVELASINRIRVETALSRFPIYWLAKKGSISIDLQRISENGEADFKWEVTYSTKHGQPGPLAYKVDTLIVNRRIYEVRRPIPEVIRLGSLSAICQELDLVDSGGNIADVKRALHQNAKCLHYCQDPLQTEERSGALGGNRVYPVGAAFDNVVTLSQSFFDELMAHPIPVDMEAVRGLLDSPGELDFYIWIDFRFACTCVPNCSRRLLGPNRRAHCGCNRR